MVPALKFNEHVLAYSNQVSNLVRGEANLVSFPNFVEDTDYSAMYKLHYLKIKPYYKSTRLTRVYNFQIFQEKHVLPNQKGTWIFLLQAKSLRKRCKHDLS